MADISRLSLTLMHCHTLQLARNSPVADPHLWRWLDSQCIACSSIMTKRSVCIR